MKEKDKLPKLFSLKGKNVVITGSSGLLGSQYSHTVSEVGANVILVDIDQRKNDLLCRSLKKKFGNKPKSYIVDISKKDQVLNLRKKIQKDFKKIHGLVNNAAFTTKTSKNTSSKSYLPLESFSIDIWKKSLDVNLTGLFLCCQQIGSIMIKGGGGSIVNVASTYGIVGADQRIYGKSKLNSPASYAATKGGVVNLTRYLASYWHGKNIRVNTLIPGGVQDLSYQSKDFVKRYSERTMLGRMAKKNEYNGAILFLLSDASSYMTGASLVIDGGWTAW